MKIKNRKGGKSTPYARRIKLSRDGDFMPRI